MVIFGAAIRPLLPAGAWPWPSSSMPAESGKTQSIWRLCNQPDITHRRVGQAELHFFSADVILVGEELQVELLWTATSDDSCIMVGSNSERENDTYYSFLHTLPHSHLMHWECAFNMPQGIEFHSSSAAASTSLSGFTSISTCRVPPDTAAAKLLKCPSKTDMLHSQEGTQMNGHDIESLRSWPPWATKAYLRTHTHIHIYNRGPRV